MRSGLGRGAEEEAQEIAGHPSPGSCPRGCLGEDGGCPGHVWRNGVEEEGTAVLLTRHSAVVKTMLLKALWLSAPAPRLPFGTERVD